jgi:hypothetical protein
VHQNRCRYSGLYLIRIVSVAVALFTTMPGIGWGEDAKASQAELMKHLSPQGRAWLTKELAKARRDPEFTVSKARTAAVPTTNYAILGSMPDGDIEALAFLVLMQASKSAQEDVKAAMAGVKAINDKKKMQRKNLDQVKEDGKLRRDCLPQCATVERASGLSGTQASKLQSEPHSTQNLKTVKTAPSLLVAPGIAKVPSGARH